MNSGKYFKKLRNNLLIYLLHFFSLQEKINFLKINKKFNYLIKETKIIKYFRNVLACLKKNSVPVLFSNDSQKIEEFLSVQIKCNKINDEYSWKELVDVVLFFLSKKVYAYNSKLYIPEKNNIKTKFYLFQTLKLLQKKYLNLNIEKRLISKTSGKILAKYLKKNKIENLCIYNCRISKNGISEFLNYFQNRNISHLEEINVLKSIVIKSCKFGDQHIIKFLSCLKENNFENIKRLDLSYSNIDFSIVKYLSENSDYFKLKKLILDGNAVTVGLIFYLCKYMLQNDRIRKLSLLSCNFNRKCFAFLIYFFLQKMPAIVDLGINIKNFSAPMLNNFYNCLLYHQRIEKLRLTICEFSNYGMISLSKFLLHPCCRLKKLELNKIEFKFHFEKYFQFFMHSLYENKSLESINFKECYFSNEQITALATLLSNKNFKSFKIENFKFSLKSFYLSFKSLIKLSLTNNDFTLSDVKELLMIFKNNSNKIEELNLECNPYLFPDLDSSGLIIQMILSLKNLKKLKLKNNFISYVDQDKIVNFCARIERKIEIDF